LLHIIVISKRLPYFPD